ncbi:hypothetical protein GCM10019059_35830 [Camelimonas fluminis]|uniref:Uncharacterized protein n=1 Tax=Camelimonas fluminis TaxID=1576911 RepID=A0ABV7UF73_9HYPH|nr:hypothetical protein [Camelimonas fluminis]GHE73036.1 hypothetical protein GCM10019059_35830 [Camelimonas fluminis]
MHIVPPRHITYHVVRHDGARWEYPSLRKAIISVHNAMVSRWGSTWIWNILSDRFIRVEPVLTCSGYINTTITTEFIIIDDLGDPVPISLLRSTYQAIRPRRKTPSQTHSGKFRDGPWPHTAYRFRGKHYRRICTKQQTAWQCSMDVDLAEAGIDPVKAGRMRKLPSSRDGIYRHRERNWKANRRHQWR